MSYSYAKKFTSWSFSRLGDYDRDSGGCPAKAKYKHLDKLPEPKGDALVRGSAIHELAEKYVMGEGRVVPKELKMFAELFKKLRKAKKETPDNVLVEQMWGFRKDWSACEWDDWTHCWLRIKIDITFVDNNVVEVIDWKTGKFRPENNQEYLRQLDLYATGVLIKFAHVPDLVVRPKLVYLDHGIVHPPAEAPIEYKHTDLKRLKKTWENRTKKMFADTTFKPEPGNGCRWCHFSKAKGGPCVY